MIMTLFFGKGIRGEGLSIEEKFLLARQAWFGLGRMYGGVKRVRQGVGVGMKNEKNSKRTR